ncbi:hypothetical protein F5Y01DRAFT_6823 [Xylaria sp. FL0043]|nr:hypothetical protein F5Y01DRAFT_6823 [Xylaria sp. FL0043]
MAIHGNRLLSLLLLFICDEGRVYNVGKDGEGLRRHAGFYHVNTTHNTGTVDGGGSRPSERPVRPLEVGFGFGNWHGGASLVFMCSISHT